MGVSLRNVSKEFGAARVIEDVSMDSLADRTALIEAIEIA